MPSILEEDCDSPIRQQQVLDYTFDHQSSGLSAQKNCHLRVLKKMKMLYHRCIATGLATYEVKRLAWWPVVPNIIWVAKLFI